MSWLTFYLVAAFITFVALVKSGLTKIAGKTVPASVHWFISAGFGCLGVMNLVQAFVQGSLVRGIFGLLCLLLSALRALEAHGTPPPPQDGDNDDRPL